MNRQRLVLLLGILSVIVAVPTAWVLAQGSGGVEFDDASIIIEVNATDGDAGIQIFMDGEGWRAMTVTDPTGRRQLELNAEAGIGAQGLTEFFFESAEPSFDEQPLSELLARFPEGEYTYTGETIDGEEISGSAVLSHTIPAAPVTSPGNDEVVSAADPVVIAWEEVTEPADVEIVGYQVIVEREEPVLRVFSVDMPADARRVTVPAEFIEADANYKYEVLAIDASGNQTITEVEFETE